MTFSSNSFQKYLVSNFCLKYRILFSFQHHHQPYAFGYSVKDHHGEQHREESGIGGHAVKGSYGFKDDRGVDRQVHYVADHAGFRAEVKTNEPGTTNQDPAAVKIHSSAHPYFGNHAVHGGHGGYGYGHGGFGGPGYGHGGYGGPGYGHGGYGGYGYGHGGFGGPGYGIGFAGHGYGKHGHGYGYGY